MSIQKQLFASAGVEIMAVVATPPVKTSAPSRRFAPFFIAVLSFDPDFGMRDHMHDENSRLRESHITAVPCAYRGENCQVGQGSVQDSRRTGFPVGGVRS